MKTKLGTDTYKILEKYGMLSGKSLSYICQGTILKEVIIFLSLSLSNLARLPKLEHWLQMHFHSYIRMNEILRNITLKQL